jgi:hypothetical protein
MPALWPIVIIPVPAPTTPSATGPSVAPSMACRTWSTVIQRRYMSSSHESSHSPITGITASSAPAANIASTTAS